MYAIRSETAPMDPNCPNQCAQVTYDASGGTRSISWCKQCNDYNNRQFTVSQEARRQRALQPDPTTREEVILRAEIANAGWPQYIGMWRTPEWRLIRFVADVETKMGLAFKVGDLSIGYLQTGGEMVGTIRSYSWRNECNTSVFLRHAVFVEDGQ